MKNIRFFAALAVFVGLLIYDCHEGHKGQCLAYAIEQLIALRHGL